MADLTYPMALGASLDSLHTAGVSAETYLRAWNLESDGRLQKSERRLGKLPAGTPVEILRKEDRNFNRLFYAMENCIFYLQDSVNELEKSPLSREEKQKVYAQLYETALRVQGAVHEVKFTTGANGEPKERYPAFFRHLDRAVSQELVEPAQRKYPLQYTLFSPGQLAQEAQIPLEEKLGRAAGVIQSRTSPELIAGAMEEGAKHLVDFEYYSKKSKKVDKIEQDYAESGRKYEKPVPLRPKNRSKIFKLTPSRISGIETARIENMQNAAVTRSDEMRENAVDFTASTTREGPIVYDVIASGVEGYSGADRMLKGTKTGRAASIIDQYFGLGLFEGKTPDERKRAYNDFLKEMGHSPQFVALVANIKTYQQDADGKMVEKRSSSNDLRMNDIVGISQQLLASPQLAQLAADFKAKTEQKKNLAGAEQIGLPKRVAQMR